MLWKRCVSLVLLLVCIIQVSTEWDKWSTWSNCTRPCGGGVTQRSRKCVGDNYYCVGQSVDYNMCNIQDCPDGTPNFRMQQCAAYNKIPYKGKRFQWADFTHSAGECELKCMPKKHFFYVTFKEKVVDGTRCNRFTLDVCINGTCQPVGCDSQLRSGAKVDECGVCRGDGSTCFKTEETFRVTADAIDYVDVVVIPEGATNIKIKESGKIDLYLALSTTNDRDIVNSNYVFTNAGKSKFRNNVLVYERNEGTGTNQITINGPIDIALQVKVYVFKSQKGKSVTYEYYLPTSKSSVRPQKVEYAFVAGDWTRCSKTCASGTHKRNVYCVNKATGRKVASFYCNNVEKPKVEEKCNIQACPARWYITTWSSCSTTCGRGLRTRRVHCVRTKEDGNIEMLADEACDGETPKRAEVCVDQGSCPKWIANEWNECSKSCGDGVQKRTVACMSMEDNSVGTNKCSEEEKPITLRMCFNAPCGSNWRTTQWGECSAECGQGVRTRQVTCVNAEGYEVPASYCDQKKEPKLYEECSRNTPCEAKWRSTVWSKCSGRCGRGVQYRTVHCTIFNLELNRIFALEPSKCTGNDKPVAVRRCKNEKPCRVRYYVSKWSACSSACDTGISRRNVLCYADRIVDYSQRACAKLARPIDVKLCKNTECVESSNEADATSSPSLPVATTKQSDDFPAQVVSLKGPLVLNKGDNADYICNVVGRPKPTVTWYLNDRLIKRSRHFYQLYEVSTEYGSKLNLVSASEKNEGELKCVAENDHSSAFNKVQIQVFTKPTAVITEKYVVKKVRQSHVISCQVDGKPTPSITWKKAGKNFTIDGARIFRSGTNLVFRSLNIGDTGRYDCIAANAASSVTASVHIKILPSNDNTSTGTTTSIQPGNLSEQCLDQPNRQCHLAKELKLCEFPHYDKVICCLTCQQLLNTN